MSEKPASGPVDVLIVGAGPVGIACAVEAARRGLSNVIIEKGALLETLRRWPVQTVFFSTPDLLEIAGVPFVTASTKPTRREGLVYYRKVAEANGLDIRLYERVLGVRRPEDLFEVTTSKGLYLSRRVVLATGFFDHPNLLGVPGEELAKVSHYYTEPYPYVGTGVLVVGGKNSAVEAALELHRGGARVTMAVRKPTFGESVKYWLRPDVENRVKEGSIQAFFETTVVSIEADSVTLSRAGRTFQVRNDFVLALTGYHPDFDFLRSCGVVVTAEGDVVHDEATLETSVKGLYVAGVVAAGAEIGRLFIENGRIHAAVIARHVLASLGREARETIAPPPIRRFQDGE